MKETRESALVKGIRAKSGLTQTEFAKKIGVSKVYIAFLEAGRKEPSLALLQRIANAFKAKFSLDFKPQRLKHK